MRISGEEMDFSWSGIRITEELHGAKENRIFKYHRIKGKKVQNLNVETTVLLDKNKGELLCNLRIAKSSLTMLPETVREKINKVDYVKFLIHFSWPKF